MTIHKTKRHRPRCYRCAYCKRTTTAPIYQDAVRVCPACFHDLAEMRQKAEALEGRRFYVQFDIFGNNKPITQ